MLQTGLKALAAAGSGDKLWALTPKTILKLLSCWAGETFYESRQMKSGFTYFPSVSFLLVDREEMLFTCQLVTLLHYKLLTSRFQVMTAKYTDSSQISQSVISGASVSAWAWSLVRGASRFNSFAWRKAWKSWDCPSIPFCHPPWVPDQLWESGQTETHFQCHLWKGQVTWSCPPWALPTPTAASATLQGPCPPKASRSPQPRVKYRSRGACVWGVCEAPPGRGLGASTRWYFSILLLAICWLPQWELFVGLKPRSVPWRGQPSFARNHLCSSSSIFSILIVIFIFISVSQLGRVGKAASKPVGWRCQLHGERQEFSSPWAKPALLRGWLPFAHLCGFQPLHQSLTPPVPGYHSCR